MFLRTLLLSAVLLPMSALADDDAEAALTAFFTRVDTLRADFTQTQLDEFGTVLQTSEGRFWLDRPGRFRWEVAAPFAQTVVSDGETLWFHDPDLKQVSRRPVAGALDGTPAALLAEDGDLAETFRIESLPSDEAQTQRLRLTPRGSAADFHSVTMTLRESVPHLLRFEDQLGGITEIRFTEIALDTAIAPERLRFEPPAGSDVVDLQ